VPIAAIGDHLAEGAIAVNARRVVTYVNRIATALLGIRADALIGRDVLTIAGASQRDSSSQFARALSEVLERGVEHVLSLNDIDAAPSFNVDYCRLLPIADGGALILLGETMSPGVSERLSGAHSLADILQRINQSLEVERVLHLLATHAAQLIGGRGATVFLLENGELITGGRSRVREGRSSAIGRASPRVLPATWCARIAHAALAISRPCSVARPPPRAKRRWVPSAPSRHRS
jgi:hypothetical protein